MAKKQEQEESQDARRNRRDVLLERKSSAERQQVRTVVLAVVGLLLLILVAALIIEYVVRPNQAVATVNGDEITLRQWEERVKFQRAQLIISLEEITELQNGDIGMTQQFAGQQIGLLAASQAETLGQLVLDQMIDEVLVRQEADRRGITVSEAEIDERIAEGYNYFDGESPTPFPTSTATVEPTPSLTPIPTDVITEVVDTPTPFPTATLGPTSTPRPTATPVSEETFQELLDEDITSFRDLGVDEDTYRAVIAAQILNEKLLEQLADEAEVPEAGPHASVYVLYYATREEAEAAQAEISSSDFVTVWNTVRSAPVDPAAAEAGVTPARASEFLWRNEESLTTTFDEEIAAMLMEINLDTPTEILEQDNGSGTIVYLIMQVSGREIRDFTENKIDNDRRQVLTDWVADQRLTGVHQTELWRNRVPSRPRLDSDYFIAQPTFTVAPVFVPEEEDGG
ncbi:MAG: SurA N-terminal domain-containing protein [Anaerolineales bacterium]|nr:SurA N-terminal domain-containing protein [Anaerolineales bacterium]MCB0027324.1 SurA N-terminal domain-containing protein [Anaerolineales bacterium]